MSRNFVNLNINPCKMCMPMGSVMAFKGIEGSMMILHGSQGCSTYIRRHMATHYNEPIDIASSSLSEQGTVYGGADNLKKGIKNIIRMYQPKVIGVSTTCLAETIGEDIERIIAELVSEDNINEVKIVPVPTPGYGGTQFEGYYKALRKIVQHCAYHSRPNNKINIITANLNPGDIRHIKEILSCFGIDYILLPDISETLDSPYQKDYRRIAEGGTTLEDIGIMAGAAATIEMGLTLEDNDSPGKYLEDQFGVPCYKCPIPIGLKNTDAFIGLLSNLTRKEVPLFLQKERGRYLDAMIDSHKYNSEGRAVIYGEPELVYAMSKLCFENGILPVLIATGTKNQQLKELLKETLEDIEEKYEILDDIDFETIQKIAVQRKANLMIGSSDGRRIEEKNGISLVRVGFPVHDRIGAQRQIYVGYYGSMRLMDTITNTILENKEGNYRKDTFNKYYKAGGEDKMSKGNIKVIHSNVTIKSNQEKSLTHPCYNHGAHDCARMHIPVAPKCNISCNYCSRKFDCPNESRPGVTSEVLTPEQALEKFIEVKKRVPNLKVVGIAGPGDALANFEQTKKALELIRQEDPEITFCLSTNGLMLPFYANDLISAGVSHVTVTINAVDEKIGAKIYKHIKYLGTKYTGEEAAEVLRDNQLAGLKFLSEKGVVCKVNIVMIKGINDQHISDVVKTVKECGAFMTNIMQMIPVEGSVFENKPLVSNAELNIMRQKCEIDLKQMYHCKQCRADAIGTLEHDCSIEFRNGYKENTSCEGKGCESASCGSKCSSNNQPSDIVKPDREYKFAIATKSGLLIDQHFGHAEEFYIYNYQDGNNTFIEKRVVKKYCTGLDDCDENEDKIEKIISTVSDVDAVLVLRAGMEPTKKLDRKGIRVIQMYERIEKGIILAVEQLEKDEKLKAIY